MKKILILILTLTSIIGISMAASAHGPGPWGPGPGHHPPPPPPCGKGPDDRMEARQVLDETQEWLNRAERVAYGPLREDLRRAYDLQADARDFYRQWRYHRAIQFSFRAREIAQDITERAERRPPPPPPFHHHDDDDGDSSIHIKLRL